LLESIAAEKHKYSVALLTDEQKRLRLLTDIRRLENEPLPKGAVAQLERTLAIEKDYNELQALDLNIAKERLHVERQLAGVKESHGARMESLGLEKAMLGKTPAEEREILGREKVRLEWELDELPDRASDMVALEKQRAAIVERIAELEMRILRTRDNAGRSGHGGDMTAWASLRDEKGWFSDRVRRLGEGIGSGFLGSDRLGVHRMGGSVSIMAGAQRTHGLAADAGAHAKATAINTARIATLLTNGITVKGDQRGGGIVQ
jgi:hypothetical protein